MLDVSKTYAQIQQNKLVISNGNNIWNEYIYENISFKTLVPKFCCNIGCTSWCEVPALPKTEASVINEGVIATRYLTPFFISSRKTRKTWKKIRNTNVLISPIGQNMLRNIDFKGCCEYPTNKRRKSGFQRLCACKKGPNSIFHKIVNCI